MICSVVLAVVVTTSAVDIIGRTQSAAARGTLTCNGKPAAGVHVKLYDSDTYGISLQVESIRIRGNLWTTYGILNGCEMKEASGNKLFTKIILTRMSRSLDEAQPVEQAELHRGFSSLGHIQAVVSHRNTILPGVLDTDDLMDSGKTDANGDYSLSGHTKEVTNIEPYIAIYHDCNDGAKPCQRTFRVGIPSRHVTDGKTPKSIYEAGQLELAGKYQDEGRSCLN